MKVVSHRETWIETFCIEMNRTENEVVSHRETWIETAYWYNSYTWPYVVSHRETWIETFSFLLSPQATHTSSLTERRGLKHGELFNTFISQGRLSQRDVD